MAVTQPCFAGELSAERCPGTAVQEGVSYIPPVNAGALSLLTVGARECGQSGSGTAAVRSGSAPVVTPQEVLVCILALLLQHSRIWFPIYCLEKCSLCRIWCFLRARD